MNEQKFPWAMDKPIDEVGNYLEQCVVMGGVVTIEELRYLLTRLKKAESERDEYKRRYEEIRFKE